MNKTTQKHMRKWWFPVAQTTPCLSHVLSIMSFQSTFTPNKLPDPHIPQGMGAQRLLSPFYR